MAKNLYTKLYDAHVVRAVDEGTDLLYIDRHLIHEVTSPQAFDGLRLAHRPLRCPQKTFATMDHNVSTTSREITDGSPMAQEQMKTLLKNCMEFNVPLYDLKSDEQGIVHIIGPDLGLTLPGTTIVCGDSHTATHGAFGALAFGIGTSEVEHVFATQTLKQKRVKTMKVQIDGPMPNYLSAKDLILAVIGKISHAGGTGYAVEYCGEAIRGLSMSGRMTICNMAIEMGAKYGIIGVDDTTIDYLKDKPKAPKGENWDEAVAYWKTLHSDEGASFDKEVYLHTSEIAPQVTWGTNPGQVIGVSEPVPSPATTSNVDDAQKALDYMGLEAGQILTDVAIDNVFIGSCTNGRLEDLRIAAAIAKGRKVADSVHAIVVPGSALVKKQAEAEGLDKIFTDAGFEWRFAGCSMCLGMNDDKLAEKQRCASTSNRNFEGRQGRGARTHLLSPAMAAAAALAGRFVDLSEGGV